MKKISLYSIIYLCLIIFSCNHKKGFMKSMISKKKKKDALITYDIFNEHIDKNNNKEQNKEEINNENDFISNDFIINDKNDIQIIPSKSTFNDDKQIDIKYSNILNESSSKTKKKVKKINNITKPKKQTFKLKKGSINKKVYYKLTNNAKQHIRKDHFDKNFWVSLSRKDKNYYKWLSLKDPKHCCGKISSLCLRRFFGCCIVSFLSGPLIGSSFLLYHCDKNIPDEKHVFCEDNNEELFIVILALGLALILFFLCCSVAWPWSLFDPYCLTTKTLIKNIKKFINFICCTKEPDLNEAVIELEVCNGSNDDNNCDYQSKHNDDNSITEII